jgi:hypothetical protein
MQTDYMKEARRARSLANGENLVAIILTAILFYALTNDPLRTVIATLALGLLSVTTAHTARLYKQAEVYETIARETAKGVQLVRAAEDLKAGDPVRVEPDGSARKVGE